MTDAIIIVLLTVVIVFAVKKSIPHFRGEGGCCGGNGNVKAIKPKKLDNPVSIKEVSIRGMMCMNCCNKVQNALNEIDGVEARVIAEKDQAVIKSMRAIDDSEIMDAVKGAGYEVSKILEKNKI